MISKTHKATTSPPTISPEQIFDSLIMCVGYAHHVFLTWQCVTYIHTATTSVSTICHELICDLLIMRVGHPHSVFAEENPVSMGLLAAAWHQLCTQYVALAGLEGFCQCRACVVQRHNGHLAKAWFGGAHPHVLHTQSTHLGH